MTAVVHAHSPESRRRLSTVCGRPFRAIEGSHYLAYDWHGDDVTCAACRAEIYGHARATIGAVDVDANGTEVTR